MTSEKTKDIIHIFDALMEDYKIKRMIKIININNKTLLSLYSGVNRDKLDKFIGENKDTFSNPDIKNNNKTRKALCQTLSNMIKLLKELTGIKNKIKKCKIDMIINFYQMILISFQEKHEIEPSIILDEKKNSKTDTNKKSAADNNTLLEKDSKMQQNYSTIQIKHDKIIYKYDVDDHTTIDYIKCCIEHKTRINKELIRLYSNLVEIYSTHKKELVGDDLVKKYMDETKSETILMFVVPLKKNNKKEDTPKHDQILLSSQHKTPITAELTPLYNNIEKPINKSGEVAHYYEIKKYDACRTFLELDHEKEGLLTRLGDKSRGIALAVLMASFDNKELVWSDVHFLDNSVNIRREAIYTFPKLRTVLLSEGNIEDRRIFIDYLNSIKDKKPGLICLDWGGTLDYFEKKDETFSYVAFDKTSYKDIFREMKNKGWVFSWQTNDGIDEIPKYNSAIDEAMNEKDFVSYNSFRGFIYYFLVYCLAEKVKMIIPKITPLLGFIENNQLNVSDSNPEIWKKIELEHHTFMKTNFDNFINTEASIIDSDLTKHQKGLTYLLYKLLYCIKYSHKGEYSTIVKKNMINMVQLDKIVRQYIPNRTMYTKLFKYISEIIG